MAEKKYTRITVSFAPQLTPFESAIIQDIVLNAMSLAGVTAFFREDTLTEDQFLAEASDDTHDHQAERVASGDRQDLRPAVAPEYSGDALPDEGNGESAPSPCPAAQAEQAVAPICERMSAVTQQPRSERVAAGVKQLAELHKKKYLRPGTQIAYVPMHANGDLTHPDVEFGFVTSSNESGTGHYCRYWRRGAPGHLRTVANSELTPNECLVLHDSIPQGVVETIIDGIQSGEDNNV